jgi:hypothetical protein
MEVEAIGVERTVGSMAISGLEIAWCGVKGSERSIPQAAPKVSKKWQLRPKSPNLTNKLCILVNGAQGIIKRLLIPPLDLPRDLVDAVYVAQILFQRNHG